jgi:hypothetical protein
LQLVSESQAAPASMRQRLEMLRPLVNQAFDEHGRKRMYAVTVGEYPELKARIAAAAACSGKWNMTSGKPKAGSAGVFVRELLESQKLYPELESFFGSMGYAVSVSSVEEIMLCPWAEIKREASPPCRPHIPSGSQAPCGASIVFRISNVK